EIQYEIPDFQAEDQGVYHCEMTNDLLPSLVLYRNPVILSHTGSSAVHSSAASVLSVYPNPARNFLAIDDYAQYQTVQITDLMGKIVHSGAATHLCDIS